MIDDDDAIGQALGLGQLVGGQEDRDPTVGKTGDHRPHGQPALGVDAGGGLVEEHHRGLAHQGQGQRQALLLAAGQPPPGRLAHGSQPDQVEELVGVFGVVVVAGEQVEHLGGAEHGVDAPALEHDAHAPDQGGVVLVRVEPEDPHGTGGRTPVALEGLDGARLACAVRTEQGHDLTGVGGERQVVDGERVAVADDQLLTVHGCGRRSGRRSRRVDGVLHGRSRYRCRRHDRYPAG